MQPRYSWQSACAAGLLAAASAAPAHDTWFHLESASVRSGEIVMALGTGNQFPVQESAVRTTDLQRSGCTSNDGRTAALTGVRDTPTALIVRAPTSGAVATCWAQLVPYEIELSANTVQVYLKEINAPRAVHDAWAQMRSRGVVWKERYTKHARIEWRDAAPGTPVLMAAKPVGMGMDVLLESGLQPIRPGDALVFQVLRDGAPLPDFAVELRSDRHRVGIWRKTDAQGRVRIVAPLAGQWVLRGTDLRLSDTEPDTWESRFVTLAFEVARDDQNGSSLKSSARSDSQASAITTISSDPTTKSSF